jgi:hypothetical protein
MKQCSKCKELLPVECFHRNNLNRTGYAWRCKICLYDRRHADIRRTRYHTDPRFRAKAIANAVKWAEKNPERRRIIANRYARKRSQELKKLKELERGK